jgi:hypothetical protein
VWPFFFSLLHHLNIKEQEKEMACTRAVPAMATNADRKLNARALNTLKPDLTKIPKSPTCSDHRFLC